MNLDAWHLVERLRARPNLSEAGRTAMGRAYPNAPSEMLDTAAFHLFTDGREAAAEWLTNLERLLQRPEDGLDFGATWHLLYHLYNWHQFQALLPCGRTGLKEQLGDALKFLEEQDSEAAKRVLENLRAALEGQLKPPKVECLSLPRRGCISKPGSRSAPPET